MVESFFIFLEDTLTNLLLPDLFDALLLRVFLLVSILGVLLKVFFEFFIYFILSIWIVVIIVIKLGIIAMGFLIDLRTGCDTFRLWLTNANAWAVPCRLLRIFGCKILGSIDFYIHGLDVAYRTHIFLSLERITLIVIVVIDHVTFWIQSQLEIGR